MSKTKPKGFTLLSAPQGIAPDSGAFTDYGGADVSDAIDASGAYYLACFAKPDNSPTYAFHIFKDGVDVPISPRPTGRGQINPRFKVVGGSLVITYTWIGWTNGIQHHGDIPGFQPFTLGGGAVPFTLPASSPLWQLYTGAYTATDLDTPTEVALRLNKQLAALREVVGVLVQSGAVVKG